MLPVDAMQMIYNSLDAPIMEVRENVEIDGTVETVVMIYDGEINHSYRLEKF